MVGFFKPLRRKIGVVTLLIASAFAAAWIRSMSCDDLVGGWLTRHSTVHLISSNSALNFAYAWDDGSERNFIQVNGTTFREALMDFSKSVDWKTFPVEDTETEYFAWDWEFFGLSFAANDYDPIHKRAIRVSDVYFVVPLTLLSAWLLLSRPNQPHQTSETPV